MKTLTTVEFTPSEKNIHNFSTFAEKLTKCVPLRPFMEKGTIKLIQMEKGRVIKTQALKYNYPKAEEVLNERNCPIPNESTTYSIIIRKTEEPLTQYEAGRFREGGMLILSGSSVHEATLLKFENDPNASKFYGFVKCDHIDKLMKDEEPVVTPSRRGLNWDHHFMKKLKIEIENKIKPFIDAEKERRERQSKGVNEELIKRNQSMGKKLGQLYREIVKDEGLSPQEGEEDSDDNDIQVPRSGFGFIPDYYSIDLKKMQKIRLIVKSPQIISDNGKISFESNKGSISLEKKQVSISEGEHISDRGIYIIRIGVTGNKEGEIGEIIARTQDKRGIELIAKARIIVKKTEIIFSETLKFIPSEYRIKIEKPSKLFLKINLSKIPKGAQKLMISSDNNYIILDKHELPISYGKEVIEEHILMRGTRVGETGIVTTSLENFPNINCEAKIKVVSENPSSSPKGFSITFDDDLNPTQRAFCKGHEIIIYTKEPTVKRYYGENGEFAGNLSFLVLCADLITEAFCTKLIQVINEGGKLTYLDDMEVAMRIELNRQKKKRGPIIHAEYVKKDLLESERMRQEE